MGAIYCVPVSGHEQRDLWIVMAPHKGKAQSHQAFGCVRSLADPSKLGGRTIESTDIIIDCS